MRGASSTACALPQTSDAPPSVSCRTLPASEYYGSMAAGSIVGGTRVGALPQTTNGDARGHSRGSRDSSSRSTSRREPRNANAGRVDHSRAALCPQFEGACQVPLELLEENATLPVATAETLEGMPYGRSPRPAVGAHRSTWAVLTTNSLTLYDCSSRHTRLASFSLRKLRAVVPLPPHPGPSPPTNPAYGVPPVPKKPPVVCGILLGLLPSLPASARPPAPVRGSTSGVLAPGSLEIAALYFPSVEIQIKWLPKLRQAADPQPPDLPLEVAPVPALGAFVGGAGPLTPSVGLKLLS